MGLVKSFSASTPWVFTAMLHILPTTPNRNKKTAKCHGAVAKPRFVKAKTYNGAVMVNIIRLPKRVTNLPEMGIVKSCPNGKANNILPSKASERWRFCFISGMRLAHDAKLIP